ncbi:protein of unknown function [Chryseobacterium sp. JV274]|nr:protein of unknown function [Chryseobacterium sp. JV274]
MAGFSSDSQISEYPVKKLKLAGLIRYNTDRCREFDTLDT